MDGVYSVSELADLSGVSVRTLHYYDERGLLVPLSRSAAGYRRYGEKEVERLQQILVYRELGFDLGTIGEMLDGSAFDVRLAFEGQRRALLSRRSRIDDLIASIDKTLACMKGEIDMADEERFAAFKRTMVEDNERAFGSEARAKYGDEAVDASNGRVLGMSWEKWEEAKGVERALAEALREAMVQGDPSGAAARRACDLRRQWLCLFWAEGGLLAGGSPQLGRDVCGRRAFQGVLRCDCTRCRRVSARCRCGVLCLVGGSFFR